MHHALHETRGITSRATPETVVPAMCGYSYPVAFRTVRVTRIVTALCRFLPLFRTLGVECNRIKGLTCPIALYMAGLKGIEPRAYGFGNRCHPR